MVTTGRRQQVDQAIDAKRIKRLRKEVLLSRRISHRNIARIYDIGE